MNVLSTMEKQIQMLELVSEAEESVILDTEHEDGEIIDDDDDDFAPERRTPKKGSSVTSEVVIYDDHGRTAIFTSPKKMKSARDPSSYPRVSEGLRRWARDDASRREMDEGDAKHQKDSDKERRKQNVQFDIVESGIKKSKRKQQTGRKVREVKKADAAAAEDHQTHKMKLPHDPPHRHNTRHRRSSSSSDSESSTCSCSCSDDDDSSPRPQRGRGKENKRSGSLSGVRARSPLLSGLRPTLQSSSSKQPPLLKPHPQKSSPKRVSPHRSPPTQRKDGHRKSPSYSSHKLPKDSSRGRTYSYPNHRPYTKQNKTNVKRSSNMDGEKTNFKVDQSSKDKPNDLVLMKGQKQPPPGSLGEMLLKKTMKGKLKVHPEARETTAQTTAKDSELIKSVGVREQSVGESSTDHGQECYTLDQEDEDELQLRLIALQSSLRVLSDVRKEGQQDILCGLSLIERLTHTEDKGERENLSGREHLDQLQPDRDKFSLIGTLENSLLQSKWKRSSHNTAEVVEQLNEGGKIYKKRNCGQNDYIGDIEMTLDQSSQGSVRPVLAPNSPQCEFEIGAIHTNKSYMDAIDSSNKLVESRVDVLGDTKELSDCNQDPVDMDICDSSAGEDDDDTLDEELFQEVGEDITLDNRNSPFTTGMIVSDVLSNCPDNIKEGPAGPEGSQPTASFQMPVEWAYMMPPPPPPDQPVNDISNINNWCYDQNMYLQTMQAPYDSSDHYNHYSLQSVCSADWGQQQSQSPEWSCPVNKELENDATDLASELPKRSASEEGNKSDKDKVENSDASRHTAELQKDLKDLPAEHYQAFMSLVLKQQTAHPQHISATDALQRHLIEVPLMKNTNDTRHLADQQNNQLVSKRSEARRRKRERQKKIKLVKRKQGVKRWGVRKLEPVVIGIKPQQMNDSVTEEEDEDLLRAKLLIDLSRKKQQKAGESAVGHQVPPSLEKNVCLVKEIWENSPPHGILSSSDSSPVPVPRLHGGKTALLKNIHLQKSRIKEGGSPTHINRVDMHPSLSDIGGFGLDPKSSRYDYLISSDPSIHTDVPKFKFPPVKPVIINLNSDSEEEIEGGMKDQTSYEGRKKEAESEASASGTISSSIDHLLKAMRNAKPAGESKVIQDKPGSSGAGSSSKLKSKTASVDSTPSVVRHLSRTQQVEYHRLKEQLRKKELLHRRRQLQQQRPLAATRSKPAPLNTRLVTLSACSKSAGKCIGPSTGAARAGLDEERYEKMVSSSPERENDLSESEEKLSSATCSGGIPGSREVSWKEMGMLQIQLPNVGSCDEHSSMTSMEDACEGGKNEHHHIANVNDPATADESSREDEDEETLREMVLQTLQKKISERAKAEKLSETMTPEEENSQNLVTAPKDGHVANVSEVSQAATTLKVVIHQKVDELVTEAIQEGSPDRVRNVVIEEESEDENNKITIHEGAQDEDMGGEWMILDEVREEGSEGNGCCCSRNGEVNEQHSTVEDTKIKAESKREMISCVSCDFQTNDDDSKLDKSEPMFKEKASIHLINDARKTSGKGKEIISEDCLTVICSSKREGSSLEGKQKICLGIGLLKEEEMQKKGVILDDQKVCEESMIFCENRNISTDDVGNMTGTSGLTLNEKCEETQTQHTSKMCGNGENFITLGDDVSSCSSAQTYTVSPFSVNTEVLGKHRSESDCENEIKPTGSLQHVSKQINCKDEGPANHKNSTVSMVKMEQHLHDVLSVENPEKCAACSCHNTGQEVAEYFTNDSKLDTSSVEVKSFCQEMKKTGQEPEKSCGDVQIPQPKEVSVEPKGQNDTNMKSKGVCTTRRNNTNRIQIPSSANDTINFSDCFKYPTDHSIGMKSGACVDTAAVDGNVKARGGKYEGKCKKSVETKRSLILKRIEHDYSEKRTGMNKVVSQLTSLVQEATQEERQRQSLKKSVMQLSGQLKEMETQLETKSRALKTKMAHIRALQTQLTRDRQFIRELERKGKVLGQQEYGSSYTLPKVLGSPSSKTKDAYRKKQLASNIDALRQQIRDVSNRSRARLEVAAQAEDINDSIKKRGKVIKMMENPCKDSKLAEETGSQNRHMGSSGVNNQGIIKTAIKILYQSETTEDYIKQKCPKEATDNSLQAQRKIQLTETTADESNDNEAQKVPLSSGHILAKFAKTDDVRDSGFHRETEIDSSGEDRPSDVDSNKVVEQISQKISTTHSDRVEDEEMLDEMNVLCPYDLLGRCNDDSCTYQHLAQPRSGSHCLMKPSSSLTVKTNAHMLRSHPKTKMGMDSEMGWRESKSMLEEVVPDSENGIRALDIGRDKVGPETETGRTRSDTGIGKTAVETRMVEMELNTRITKTGSDTETGMMEPHIETARSEIDTRTEGIELDNRVKIVEPEGGTEWVRPDTGSLRIGTQTSVTLVPDSGTGRVESDPGIRVKELKTENEKMEQEIESGSVTEVGVMGSDSEKLGLGPDTRRRGLEQDIVKEGMRQDVKIGGTSQNTVMERLRSGAELGSKVMDIGLRRIEMVNKAGRAGPETRMRRRESSDTGTLKTRNAGMERTGPDSGLGRTEPETGICGLGPHTVKDNICKRLMSTSKTQPKEDENNSGGGTTCERIIPLSSKIENKCLGWENQANADIKHDINASSNLAASSIFTCFCKKEVPSVVNYENKHKSFKRKRSNDDSLLVNLGMENELEEGIEAKSKRTRQISGDSVNEICSPLTHSGGEESRVIDRSIHICQTKSRAVNAMTAKRDMHDKKIADKIPELNASMVIDVKDIAAKSVTDVLSVSTDTPSDPVHLKDTKSSLSVEMNCMMALEAAKPLLEGQVHDDQKLRVQEYRRKEEVSSDAITLKISVKQVEVSENSALGQPKEQQPQPDRLNFESKLLNIEDKKNSIEVNEKQLEIVVEPSRSCDSDAVISHRKRPATRKTSKIVNNASFNEYKNKAPTDHITTRRRGQELASRGSRRGRSKGSMEIIPQGGRSGCSEDSGASRRGPNRRAAHQKKNRGRNSVSRGRKK